MRPFFDQSKKRKRSNTAKTTFGREPRPKWCFQTVFIPGSFSFFLTDKKRSRFHPCALFPIPHVPHSFRLYICPAPSLLDLLYFVFGVHLRLVLAAPQGRTSRVPTATELLEARTHGGYRRNDASQIEGIAALTAPGEKNTRVCTRGTDRDLVLS